MSLVRSTRWEICFIEGGSEGLAESSESLGADRLSWLGAGLRLEQRRSTAIWTARSLVKGNRWDRCFLEGGSGRLG